MLTEYDHKMRSNDPANATRNFKRIFNLFSTFLQFENTFGCHSVRQAQRAPQSQSQSHWQSLHSLLSIRHSRRIRMLWLLHQSCKCRVES